MKLACLGSIPNSVRHVCGQCGRLGRAACRPRAVRAPCSREAGRHDTEQASLWTPCGGQRRNGNSAAGALEPQDYGRFVRFFRMASAYIEGHRGRTFVLLAPGEVRARR